MPLTTKSASGLARLPFSRAAVDATLQPLEHATMLPPAAFSDPAVLQWEIENIFRRGWVCAGHASAVAEPGAYLMREIGAESFFVLGTAEGPRGFFNVCRHRGSRLMQERAGSVRRSIRCPYHGWSYGFDGSLVAAPHTDGLERFDPTCNGLVSVRTTVIAGLVMVDLGGDAGDPAHHVGDLADLLERYRLADLRPAGERLYDVAANWKAIAENYNECLHCPGVHPELNALSDYASGAAWEGEGLWCGGAMTLNEGAETMGRSGGRRRRPPIAGLEEDDLRQVFYFSLFPNGLVSLHPDYVMLHTLWPRDAGRTHIVCEWLFEPATQTADGFDPTDAIEFWDQVNREDWHVCELAQMGMRSRGYSSGRYTTHEGDTHAFDRMVAERYLEALG